MDRSSCKFFCSNHRSKFKITTIRNTHTYPSNPSFFSVHSSFGRAHTVQGVFIFKEQNVSRRSNSDQSDAMEKGFTLFKSPSPLITLSALIKKSNEAAVSPENAKKMFDLLNETVDRYYCVCVCLFRSFIFFRFFKPCAKYEKYQRKLVNAYNYILQAIVRA